jgi:malate dehydrogenase (oxaloacetate-decarboxylating)
VAAAALVAVVADELRSDLIVPSSFDSRVARAVAAAVAATAREAGVTRISPPAGVVIVPHHDPRP